MASFTQTMSSGNLDLNQRRSTEYRWIGPHCHTTAKTKLSGLCLSIHLLCGTPPTFWLYSAFCWPLFGRNMVARAVSECTTECNHIQIGPYVHCGREWTGWRFMFACCAGDIVLHNLLHVGLSTWRRYWPLVRQPRRPTLANELYGNWHCIAPCSPYKCTDGVQLNITISTLCSLWSQVYVYMLYWGYCTSHFPPVILSTWRHYWPLTRQPHRPTLANTIWQLTCDGPIGSPYKWTDCVL